MNNPNIFLSARTIVLLGELRIFRGAKHLHDAGAMLEPLTAVDENDDHRFVSQML